MNVIITNIKTGVSQEVVLPMSEDELLNIQGDVLGRDTEGYILDNQEVCYLAQNGQGIDDIFELNTNLSNIDFNGDRECPDCQIDSLIEHNTTQWKCLKCGKVFEEKWLDSDMELNEE